MQAGTCCSQHNIILTVVLLWEFLLPCCHFCQCCQSHVVQHIWFHHSSVCSTYTNMQAVCLFVCLSVSSLHVTPSGSHSWGLSQSERSHSQQLWNNWHSMFRKDLQSHRTLFFCDVIMSLLADNNPLTHCHIPGEWDLQSYCGRILKTCSLDLS